MQEERETIRPKENYTALRRRKNVGYALAVVVIVLVTVLVTFSLTVTYYHKGSENNRALAKKFDVISGYIDKYAYFDADHKEMEDAALKAFVSSSGDRYSVYYNAEAFDALKNSNHGLFVGIGVEYVEEPIVYDGNILTLMRVTSVHEDSPADSVGILSGDLIYSVYTDDGEVFADDVGRDVFTSLVKGKAGTTVNISILRMKSGKYQKMNLTVERREVLVKSVSHFIEDDTGIVRISQFDLNTPMLLSESLDAIKAEGISKIVIDMRSNGGGDLNSVIACASYFLEEGNLILSSEDNEGKVLKYKASARTLGGEFASCSVSKKDVGKYKDFKMAVLVNKNTASAAELLTAVFRDYKLATIVGVNTYGKGTIQTVYSFAKYGLDGGMKITTDVYFPPCGVSYDGVGIEPDVIVEYEQGSVDNQLQAAIKSIK